MARHLGILLESRDVHIDFAVIVTIAPMSTTGNFIYRARQNPNVPDLNIQPIDLSFICR